MSEYVIGELKPARDEGYKEKNLPAMGSALNNYHVESRPQCGKSTSAECM